MTELPKIVGLNVAGMTETCFFPSETENENDYRPLDGRLDEFHPKATRTLFIGNLEKTTSYQQLLDIFQRFGEIVVSSHTDLCCETNVSHLTVSIIVILVSSFQGHRHQESKWDSSICLCPVL